MPIQAQSADGLIHEFPDGTDPSIVDKTMKSYATKGGGKTPEDIGTAGSVMTGMGDPLVKMRQVYSHLAKSPEEAGKVDIAVNKREQDLANRNVGSVGRMVGQGIMGAPITAAATAAMGPVAGGAIAGGAMGAMQPVTNQGQGNFWGQTESDMLWGTTFGAGGSLALKGLSSALGGVTDPAKRALMDSGVQLTPGQLGGGVARRAEEAFKSFPILGSFIRGAEGRGIEGFNRAILNQSLEPFGGKLPDGVVAGNGAIKTTYGLFKQAYDKGLQGTKLGLDADLSQRLTDIRASAAELGPDLEKQFNKILDNRLSILLRPGSNVPPKQAIGDVMQFADQYRPSGSPSERIMSQKFDQVKKALIDAVARQNPQQAGFLRKVDMGYAMFARARAAATRRATSEGVFSPADLLQTIKSMDKSRGHTTFATGDSLLQTYAQYGQKVLPGKMPDSGTTERAMWDVAGMVYAREHPLLAAGLGLGSLPYTKTGMNVINRVASGSTPGAASVVRRVAPYAAGGLGSLGTQPSPDEPTPYGGPQQ